MAFKVRWERAARAFAGSPLERADRIRLGVKLNDALRPAESHEHRPRWKKDEACFILSWAIRLENGLNLNVRLAVNDRREPGTLWVVQFYDESRPPSV